MSGLLKAPYPYFGGKAPIADLVWSRLGDVDNYIEPFFGSGAVAIARPHPPRIECYGDWSAYISNFFRAIAADPDAVAHHCGHPVSEADLHARHRWLMGVAEPEPGVPPRFARHPLLREAYLAGYARQDGSYGRAFRRRMRTDPDYFDAKVAGYWAWGACCWIGSGWCEEDPAEVEALVAGHEGIAVAVPSDQMPRAPNTNWSQDGGNSIGVHAEKGPELAGIPDGKTPLLSAPANEHGRREHLGRGVHRKAPEGQVPDLTGDVGVAGRGVHAIAGPDKMPRLAGGHHYGGLGIHADVVPPPEQLPKLAGGGKKTETTSYGGSHVHADVIPPVEKRPALHTGNSEHGRGVHGEAKPSAEWEQIPLLDSGGGSGGIKHGRGVHGKANSSEDREQIPFLSCGGGGTGGIVHGQGIHAKGPLKDGRPQLADLYSLGRGVHGNDSAGSCAQRHAWLCAWFRALADRFRTSRFCCGDWTETVEAWRRICNSPSTTTRLGTVGMFLDPPYRSHSKGGKKSRAAGLYGKADRQGILDRLNDDVLAYCLAHGGDPLFRIAVCAYIGDGYEVLAEQHGWDLVRWRARGGYGNRTAQGRANRDREVILFSPHCLKPGADRPVQRSMFDGVDPEDPDEPAP